MDYRKLVLDNLERQIERAEKAGISGKGLFNETGYFKWNQLDKLSEDEIQTRAAQMQWFLDGMDGWLAGRLKKEGK